VQVVVATSVPLVVMGAVPAWLLQLAEGERALNHGALANDTAALLDALPDPDRTALVAGDVHMHVQSLLCAAQGPCIPQWCTSGMTRGSTVGSSAKLLFFSALWYHVASGAAGPWAAVHQDAAIGRNWLRLTWAPRAATPLTVTAWLDPSDAWSVTVPEAFFHALPLLPSLVLALLTMALAARTVYTTLFGPPPDLMDSGDVVRAASSAYATATVATAAGSGIRARRRVQPPSSSSATL
jgi:hypothetical protein